MLEPRIQKIIDAMSGTIAKKKKKYIDPEEYAKMNGDEEDQDQSDVGPAADDAVKAMQVPDEEQDDDLTESPEQDPADSITEEGDEAQFKDVAKKRSHGRLFGPKVAAIHMRLKMMKRMKK